MSVHIDRGYHDLSEEEKKRYDRLRTLERRLFDRGGIRARRCGSRAERRRKIKAAADAMIGYRVVDDRIAQEPEPGDKKPWVGSSTRWMHGRTQASS